MTWRTSQGVRVLSPYEAHLFLDFFDHWWDINDQLSAAEKDSIMAEEPFNSLSTAQQHSVVEEVVIHLLSKTDDIPNLSAANESCIFSIYQDMIEQVLETKADIYGPGILDALEERGCSVRRSTNEERKKRSEDAEEEQEEDEEFWPYMGCQDEGKWNDAIEFLADCILWDRDWEMPEVQDNPALMDAMRINPEYFREPQAIAGAKERVERFRLAKILERGEAGGD